MKRILVVISLLVAICSLSFGMFMVGYEYHQPREIIVERWHEPEVKVVETVRYAPLPDEYLDAAIAVLERASYSHEQFIILNGFEDDTFPHHKKCIDSYAIAMLALEHMKGGDAKQ